MNNNQLYGAFGCLLVVGYAITTWAACSLNPKEQDISSDLSSVIITKPYSTASSTSSEIPIIDEPDAVTEIGSSAVDSSSEVQEYRIDYYIGYDDSSNESLIEQTAYVEEVDNSYESLEIPQGDCSSFLYMDYRAITDTSSKQWELQQVAWTDNQGFRRMGDDYCVALGTFYGQVGDRFRITTNRGNVYSVIQADAKGWDSNGWYHVAGDGRINLVEFIIQTEYLPSEVSISGDCGVLDNIGGNVVKIERLE